LYSKKANPHSRTKPQNLYELIHGPSYDVEAINVDEMTQMNGSLIRRLRNFRSSTIEYEVREERVISLARWFSRSIRIVGVVERCPVVTVMVFTKARSY
jgi:hypothetical protein